MGRSSRKGHKKRRCSKILNESSSTPDESSQPTGEDIKLAVHPVSTSVANNDTNDPHQRKSNISTKRNRKAERSASPLKKRKRSAQRHRGHDAAAADSNDAAVEDVFVSSSSSTIPTAPTFPYPVGEDDHCESPLEAYKDILPLLNYLKGNKSAADVCIYDPYYCDGAVVTNLSALGFSNVYNKKEDCYQVWSDPARYPSFDIFVTNPPYSGDHMERLIQHLTVASSPVGRQPRPWFLLMPTWVHKKDWYVAATAHLCPFYLVPRKRYVYRPPKDFRASKKSDTHIKSSPFCSMWYIYGCTEQERLMEQFFKWQSNQNVITCDLARSKSALRYLRRKKR